MSLFDRLRQELGLAGRSAQNAFDEGRLRLDLFRARQSMDKFAERFGYETYRAKKTGAELSADVLAAHMNNLTAADAEITRLETLIAEAGKRRRESLPPRDQPPPDEPRGR
jgi:hypothetical protein